MGISRAANLADQCSNLRAPGWSHTYFHEKPLTEILDSLEEMDVLEISAIHVSGEPWTVRRLLVECFQFLGICSAGDLYECMDKELSRNPSLASHQSSQPCFAPALALAVMRQVNSYLDAHVDKVGFRRQILGKCTNVVSKLLASVAHRLRPGCESNHTSKDSRGTFAMAPLAYESYDTQPVSEAEESQESEDKNRMKKRKRPCKGQRERFRNLLSRLKEQYDSSPETFSICLSELPPSVQNDPRILQKVEREMQSYIEERSPIPFAQQAVGQEDLTTLFIEERLLQAKAYHHRSVLHQHAGELVAFQITNDLQGSERQAGIASTLERFAHTMPEPPPFHHAPHPSRNYDAGGALHGGHDMCSVFREDCVCFERYNPQPPSQHCTYLSL